MREVVDNTEEMRLEIACLETKVSDYDLYVKKCKSLEVNIKELNSELMHIENDAAQANDIIERLKKEKAQLERDCERLTDDVKAYMQFQIKLEEEMKTMEADGHNYAGALSDKTEQNKKLQYATQQLETEIIRLKQDLREAKASLESLEEQLAGQKDVTNHQKKEIEALKEQIQRSEEDNDGLRRGIGNMHDTILRGRAIRDSILFPGRISNLRRLVGEGSVMDDGGFFRQNSVVRQVSEEQKEEVQWDRLRKDYLDVLNKGSIKSIIQERDRDAFDEDCCFSEDVFRLNDATDREPRHLVITSTVLFPLSCLYILSPPLAKYFVTIKPQKKKILRFFDLSQIQLVCFVRGNVLLMGIRVANEMSLMIETCRRAEILAFLKEAFNLRKLPPFEAGHTEDFIVREIAAKTCPILQETYQKANKVEVIASRDL